MALSSLLQWYGFWTANGPLRSRQGSNDAPRSAFSRWVNWLEGFFLPLLTVVGLLLFLFARPMFFGALTIGALALVGLSVLSWFRTGSLRVMRSVPFLVVCAGIGYSVGFLRELLFPE